MSGTTSRKKQNWIRPLPERLINKIAAGEVVERPASVVKELVENALDSGADRIEIVVEKSGGKLIRILDNGCGLHDDQIEIAFSRHATSKISEYSDLDSITSYGFRGEALPSIASVSQLRMVSRPQEAEAATEIVFEGGVLQSREPASAPPGTTIEVRNLFFNTPARRKFLKAESTELRHISRTAMALAIGRYDVGFAYTVNDRQVFSEPSGLGLKERVGSLLATGKEMVAVSGEIGPVKVEGYIGYPEQAQSNRNGQYIFINGRFIQSATLSHAFVAGYGEMMPRGRFPIGALLLTVDPMEIDINVHPAKTEVRLSHEREIHDAVYRLIKDALRHDGVIPSVRIDTTAGPAGMGSSTASVHRSSAGSSNRIPGVGELSFTNREFLSKLYTPPQSATAEPSSIETVDTCTGEIVERENSLQKDSTEPTSAGADEAIRMVGRFSDLYLIFQRRDELLIVDQHTAHERVLFEDLLRQIERQSVVAQGLLIPVQVELSPEQLALYDEVEPLLNQSGFSIEHFGGRTIKIEAVPSVLTRRSPETSVVRILDDFSSLKKAGYDLKKAMAQSIACRSAVMAGDRLSDREAMALIIALLKCENMYSCPHGRPTLIRMTRSDLDRQFGRG